MFLTQRARKGEKRIKAAQKQKEGERKMTCLLVKAGNCPKCQPIVYQRSASTCSSYYSLPVVSLCLSLIPSSGTPAAALQWFSKTVTHARARTLHRLPPCLRDLSAPLEHNEEETLSLLEHVRQIRHHRPRKPQIHPSSPAHLISAVKRRGGAMGQKVQERMEIVVKRGNWGEDRGRRGGMVREK